VRTVNGRGKSVLAETLTVAVLLAEECLSTNSHVSMGLLFAMSGYEAAKQCLKPGKSSYRIDLKISRLIPLWND
jgi:hypothetical protein